MANKLDKEYCSIKATKELLKNNPEISVDQVKGYDRRARASPFIMEHVKIIQTLTEGVIHFKGCLATAHENEKAYENKLFCIQQQVVALQASEAKLTAENEKLKAKNEHEKEAVREYHKLHVADTYICGNGICKGKTYEEAKRIIIDKEGSEYWELWRKRVNWEFCN